MLGFLRLSAVVAKFRFVGAKLSDVLTNFLFVLADFPAILTDLPLVSAKIGLVLTNGVPIALRPVFAQLPHVGCSSGFVGAQLGFVLSQFPDVASQFLLVASDFPSVLSDFGIRSVASVGVASSVGFGLRRPSLIGSGRGLRYGVFGRIGDGSSHGPWARRGSASRSGCDRFSRNSL